MNPFKIGIWAFILCYLLDGNLAKAQLRDTTLFNKAKDSTVLYIDWSKMSPQVKALFIKILAKVDERNDFVSYIKIQPNQNISRLIKRRFAVVAEQNKSTHQALVDILHDLNGLDQKNTLIVGSFIKVPRLPVKQDNNCTKELTQFFDPYIKQSYILATASSEDADFTAALANEPFSRGGLSAIKLSPQDLSLVQSMIPKELYWNLYGKGFATLDSVKISTIYYPERINTKTTAAQIWMISDSAVIKMLKGLDKSYFKKYYVFDNFNGLDDHGKKVLDVINDRFVSYGLDTVGLSIIPIPINYFDNLQFGHNLLLKNFGVKGTSTNGLAVEVQREVNQLSNLDTSQYVYARSKDCIPEVYLTALFNYYYRDKPDVISSSFWAKMYVMGTLPNLYDDAPTNLITAALNDSCDLESRVKNFMVKQSLLVGQIQPIKDWINSYPKNGALIIGNRLNKNRFDGAFGKYVTTTGIGVGWFGHTILPTDTGTSFATPDVAAKIYIAKAYWRSKKVRDISAYETRLRVLLATDIDPAFIGKFDSGGGVNMLKLLQTGNYAELASGEIVPITNFSPKGAVVDFAAGDRMLIGRASLYKNVPKDGICGLAYIEGQFFKLSEYNPTWQTADCDSITFSCKTPHGVVMVSNLNDFKTNFKQLIILNNP